MLERTVGCLETSSIRRILPPSRKVVKSRRTLHSAFWNHAAGDLELSSLWAAILQDPNARKEETAVEQKNPGSNGGGLLLDFLYPAGTLNYLRNYSSWGLEREGRLGRTGFSKLGQRLYSSSATDTLPTESGDSASKNDYSKTESTKTIELTMEYLRDRMGLLMTTDYDEAWRQYHLMDGDEQKLLRKQLMNYYSTSKRIIDAERSMDLFNALEVGERDAVAFQNAVRSCLRLRNLRDAYQLNKTATEILCIPAGSNEIFSYLVEAGSWTRACTVWWDLKHWESKYPDNTYNLYTVAEKHTPIDEMAYNVVQYFNERYNQLTPDTKEQPALLGFATDLAKKAFIVRDHFDPTKFTIIFDHVRKWSLVEPTHCENLFRRLTFLGHQTFVVVCYRKLREGTGFPFTKRTLHSILKTFCNGGSIRGIEQVMDDFWNYHRHPSAIAYRLSMTAFAAMGDAKRVHELFKQFINHETRKHPARPLRDPSFLTPTMQVHSKRGEIAEVIKTFDAISERYELQPNILCWNILIATHGRVEDIDGALACYQQLLEAPEVEPDDYTIGTLMGMATKRGDLESVMALWRAAGDLKIKKSTAMVDSLVWAYIQDDKISTAEKICEDAIHMDLKGTRTRMWNYLIVGFAQRFDLINSNRVLQRMTSLKIPQDEFTYAALMQALVMNKQPDQAYAIIRDVLPRAGLKPTLYHYAVLMGGYLATNNIPRIFRIHQYLVRRLKDKSKAASVNALLLRAEARTDDWLLEQGTEAEKFQRSMEMFLSISFDPAEMARNPSRKGIYSMPLDIAYPASIHSFVMMNLAKNSETNSVKEVYERYLSAIPESRREENPPNMIISALMLSKFRERDRTGIFECWNMILSNARALKKSIVVQSPDGSSTEKLEVLYQDQLVLSKCLSWYLRALAWDSQGDTSQITATVQGLLEEGFVLDNHNWNKYVEVLLSNSRVKAAFQVCEERLMSGFSGWSMARRAMPIPDRLPKPIRDMRKNKRHLRPMMSTQLALAKAYMTFRESAMESVAHQFWLEDLERLYPQTCQMIKTMQRREDPMELMMLRDM